MIGVIGKKIGMTQMFDEAGVLTPVTVVQVEDNVVIGHRTAEKNGYDAVILGTITAKKNRVTKPVAGQFPKGIAACKIVREIRDFEKECKVGDKIGVEVFEGTNFVDVIGISKGKGYAGVMKRHGFSGGRASHGSKMHREQGSVGQNTQPARTFPGKRMAGHMGNVRRTAQNLRIVKIDNENKIILICGAVPGAINNTVIVSRAKRK
ncbi:MAG: 50S ribosomal protein L3 [Spirochaetaceae bacterium]|nr:MAG: 50S ribosomal protein L3 [Spirochaetaceae bacterium]